jgi:multiple sugar transport system ATP-binding protein
MNLYSVELGPGGRSFVLGSQTVELPQSLVMTRPGLARHASTKVVVGLRPEFLRIDGQADEPGFFADVNLVEPLGSEMLIHFGIDAAQVTASETELSQPLTIDAVGEGVARVQATTRPKPDERLRFSMAADRFHFFESDSQLAIWE